MSAPPPSPPIDWSQLRARNAPLNAFVDFDEMAAFGSGPLAGVSLGVKSNIAVAGLPWTAGLGTRREIVAAEDAAIVARLRGAGAAILGTLNMHEAALGATTDNAFYGRTINPHRDGHTPGGSSGGSGAAVAAGLCTAALGTDTLGSVRIPAAYNGVYGLKPTNGAVDDTGLVPLARSLDCIGPLARSLDMLERIWEVIGPVEVAGPALTRPLLLADLAGVEVEPGVAAAYRRAVEVAGGSPGQITLPIAPTEIRLAALAAIGRELIADLGTDRTERADLISPELHFILAAAERLTPAPALLAEVGEYLRGAIGDDGWLLMPTAPQAAFRHGQRAPANQADFTGLANIAGLPAVTIPAGTDGAGLPVGMQIVGPAGREASLLALARTLDAKLGGYAPPAA